MSFAKKLLAPLRNAFSYAVHLESAADHARKLASVEKLLTHSLPGPEDADAAYETRLRKVLMKTRTQHLDTLDRHEVRVVLDRRLPRQRLAEKDQRIDGIFYDQPGAKIVALWDDGKILSGWSEGPGANGPTMLEKLAKCLDAGMTGDMFASRYTTAVHAVGMGAGVAGCVTYTDWMEARRFNAGAVNRNPGLRTPLQKRDMFPKP
jgi:hypothetical protein